MSATVEGATRRRNHAIWLGLVLAFAGVASYFSFFARFPVLRDFPWVNLPLVLLGVGLSLLAVWRAFARPQVYRGRWLGSLAALLSVGLGGLFVVYVFFMSSWMPQQTAAGRARTNLPELVLQDHLGRPVQTADLRGRKVVLTFFRGHW